jgi:HEAT repeat protein
MGSLNHRFIYIKSGSLFMGVCLALALVDRLMAAWIHDGALRWAAASSLVEILATISISIFLLGRRAYQRFQTAIYEQIRPAIEERVMALALDGAVWSTPVPKPGRTRFVLEQCLAHALLGLKDSGRDRLAQFAVDKGFARQWEKAAVARSLDERRRAIALLGLVVSPNRDTIMRAALDDPDAEIRSEAARALLRNGDGETADRVFRSLLRESLLMRVLLVGDLKKHARHLLTHTVPRILGESVPAENPLAQYGLSENRASDRLHCLEILSMWKLAVPALDAAQLLARHGLDKDGAARRVAGRVLPLAISLLPYLALDDSIEQQLTSALTSADLEVQCAAAYAAGQLKLDALMPALAGLLGQPAPLAIAAATALAQMGTTGARHLEKTVLGSDRRAAAAALEALEALTVGTR